MKRFFAFFTALTLFGIVIASGAMAETTRRDVFSFCEIYAERLTEFEAYSGMEIATISDNYFNDLSDKDYISCCAGSIALEHWSIKEFQTELFTSYSNDNTALLVSAIIASSALEYGTGDLYPELKYLEKSTPVEIMTNVFAENIVECLSGKGLEKLIESKSVQVYKGNYTYRLDYYESKSPISGKSVQIIYLVAE